MGLDYYAHLGYGIEVEKPDHIQYYEFTYELSEYWEEHHHEVDPNCPIDIMQIGSQGCGTDHYIMCLKGSVYEMDVKYYDGKVKYPEQTDPGVTSERLQAVCELLNVKAVGPLRWHFGVWIN